MCFHIGCPFARTNAADYGEFLMNGDRPLFDAELYPTAALDRRSEVKQSGSFRERVAYGCLEHPAYAFGLLIAADIAHYFGFRKITAIEFGIGEGEALDAILTLTEEVRTVTGVAIDVVGFDGFQGLPPTSDWR